jgi:uncharacterized protein (DUF4415 family)
MQYPGSSDYILKFRRVLENPIQIVRNGPDFMSKTSKTDWNRLAKMKDQDIDTSDIPELDDDFFRKAELKVPPKQPVTLRLDSDVVSWFKSQGQGYQTRINKLLRAYMESQQANHR